MTIAVAQNNGTTTPEEQQYVVFYPESDQLTANIIMFTGSRVSCETLISNQLTKGNKNMLCFNLKSLLQFDTNIIVTIKE